MAIPNLDMSIKPFPHYEKDGVCHPDFEMLWDDYGHTIRPNILRRRPMTSPTGVSIKWTERRINIHLAPVDLYDNYTRPGWPGPLPDGATDRATIRAFSVKEMERTEANWRNGLNPDERVPTDEEFAAQSAKVTREFLEDVTVKPVDSSFVAMPAVEDLVAKEPCPALAKFEKQNGFNIGTTSPVVISRIIGTPKSTLPAQVNAEVQASDTEVSEPEHSKRGNRWSKVTIPDGYISIAQAAEVLGISPRTVRDYVKRLRITPEKTAPRDGVYVFSSDWIPSMKAMREAWVSGGSQGAHLAYEKILHHQGVPPQEQEVQEQEVVAVTQPPVQLGTLVSIQEAVALTGLTYALVHRYSGALSYRDKWIEQHGKHVPFKLNYEQLDVLRWLGRHRSSYPFPLSIKVIVNNYYPGLGWSEDNQRSPSKMPKIEIPPKVATVVVESRAGVNTFVLSETDIFAVFDLLESLVAKVQ